jgi:hypothetical protein
MVKKLSKTNDLAGDGTNCNCFGAIVKEGLKNVKESNGFETRY